MFAFAIWDESKQRLFLARDRLGQKPLFYRKTDEGFWFGSTIPAVLADPAVSPSPDESAIRSYLNFNYVPSPATGFETIRQVAPATVLSVTTDGNLSMESYWDLSYRDQMDASPETIATELRERLREATRLRMRSDVPLGAFLSGGIDSSAVVALMSELSDEPVKSYTIGFDVDQFDEIEYARDIAAQFDTDHTEYTVTSDAMLDSASELVKHYGMPFGDPSALPTYYVSKIASEDVTVAMSGDAGDENFAGYSRYGIDALLSQLSRIPAPVLNGGAFALERLPVGLRTNGKVSALRKAFEYANYDKNTRYGLLVSADHGEAVDRFWRGSTPDDEFETITEPLATSDGPQRLDRLLDTDIQTYLPNSILTKVDRASMAHSLEVRSPFLDHELMEFTAKIPSRYKRKSGDSKWILKKAFQPVLPDKVLDRRKSGFGIPAAEWFRNELRDVTRTHLQQLQRRPAFSELEYLLDEHIAGTTTNDQQLWNLLMLEKWYREYID
jgi:asparagine synthase (glutamine-hydrolysing)